MYREEAFSVLQWMKKAKYKVPIHHRFLFSPCSIKSKLFINSLSLANRTCGFFEKILWMGIIIISAWLCCSLLKWTPTGVFVELLFRTVFKWSTIRFSADLFDCPKYCFLHFYMRSHREPLQSDNQSVIWSLSLHQSGVSWHESESPLAESQCKGKDGIFPWNTF